MRLFLSKLLLAAGLGAWSFSSFAAGGPALDAKGGVGSWIWASETRDQQLCRFWRGFEIPSKPMVVKALLRITADNSYRVFLDGQELGRGGDWGDLTEHDLTLMLDPGKHVLAVEAFNDFKAAGVLAGLQVQLADGQRIEIGSDSSWKVVPDAAKGWEKRTRPGRDWPAATVVAAYKTGSWLKEPVIIHVPRMRPPALRFWQAGWFQITLLSLCAAATMVCVRLMGKLAIQSQAQQVVQRERSRIARDIHDDLTARLTQLVLLGEVAQSALPPGSEPRQQVGTLCEKARGLSRSMNEIIWAVNSQRDTFRDFASYVCKYAETFLQPTPIRCRFDLEEEMPDFPCDLGVRRNLFLAVKEAIHNAVRHSDASELVVRIHPQGPRIVVAIEDNGRGFNPAEADRERNGLSNMVKRVSEAGGTCHIFSQPGFGCRIEFAVPLEDLSKGFSGLFDRFWKRRTRLERANMISRPVSSAKAAP